MLVLLQHLDLLNQSVLQVIRHVELLVRPTGLTDPDVEVRPASTQIDDVIGECNERVALKERVLITTLTKRMAEDLTDYLDENGISSRYMHSDTDTVERVEIIISTRSTVSVSECMYLDEIPFSSK